VADFEECSVPVVAAMIANLEEFFVNLFFLRAVGVAIATYAVGAAHALDPTYQAQAIDPSRHKLHEAYMVQPHNSYNRWASIKSWLQNGLRSLELDIVDSGDWENDANGPYVAHDGGDTGNKNCSGNPDRLGHCLRDIVSWLDANPGQGPVVVYVDMKTKASDYFNDWKADEVWLLDNKVKSILGSRMYTADELYSFATGTSYTSGAKTLRQAVSEKGWPVISTLAGKVVIAYTGGRYGAVNQTQGVGIEHIMSRTGRKLPYGFFCPDVENDPNEVVPGQSVDGMNNSTSQHLVCSNLKSQDHYQVTANRAHQHKQLIHLWGDHVYGNGSYVYNYLAIAHGVSAIGRDSAEIDSWGGTFPLVGVRRSLPGYFQMRPIHATDKCVDVDGMDSDNGTRIKLYSCNGSNAQQFVYTAEGQLRPRFANTKCVDIKGGDANSGDLVHLWGCDGGSSEKWEIHPFGMFRSTRSGGQNCMAVKNGSTANETSFVMRRCDENDNSQRFRLTPVSTWNQTDF
jgi:hypothetical protein